METKIIPEVMLLDLIFDKNGIRTAFPDWEYKVMEQIHYLFQERCNENPSADG